MVTREYFVGGDLSQLVEGVKAVIPVQKYDRLKTLLADTTYTLHVRITDLLMVVIRWGSGVEWATETTNTATRLRNSLRDANFTKV